MIRTRLTALLSGLAALLFVTGAAAVNPDERLDDPVLEDRARDISAELRCLVCQNESIDASNADLAKDLRLLVRERLEAGDTDAQVIDYVVDRYGEFVLLRPRFSSTNLLLWLGPAILFALAAFGAWRFVRAQRHAAPVEPAPLSDTERRALDDLMKRDGA